MGGVAYSKPEELIFVDENDNELGYLEKAKCHDGDGVLHRAFSIFIFNAEGELLLQKRSAEKRLWPLYWSNSCCSHPVRGETMEGATKRRLAQELGLTVDLEFIYKFCYQAKFGKHGSESEVCSVFLGSSHQAFLANEQEIAATRYVSAKQLDKELQLRPEIFTPWFKMEWARLSGEFRNQLAPYLNPL